MRGPETRLSVQERTKRAVRCLGHAGEGICCMHILPCKEGERVAVHAWNRVLTVSIGKRAMSTACMQEDVKWIHVFTVSTMLNGSMLGERRERKDRRERSEQSGE